MINKRIIHKITIKNTSALTLFLLMALSTLASVTPNANAAAKETSFDTFLFVMAAPNPVGVGQDVEIVFQLDKISPTAIGVYGGDHFRGFTVTITKPDNTTETEGPFEAWAPSHNYFKYTPSVTGTYKVQASFPGQWINGSYQTVGAFTQWLNITGAPLPLIFENRWYKPATSSVIEVTVQSDPIPTYPDSPLPIDYWERPINAENKGWYKISDNWLMRGYDRGDRIFSAPSAFAPYTSAPNSPHVVWKKQQWFGGIVGGRYGDKTYYTGLSYEQPYEPMILGGRIIYSEHPPTATGSQDLWNQDSQFFGTRAIDLYTGEEIWFLNNTYIDFAQVFQYDSPNEHGSIAHLWSVSGTVPPVVVDPTLNATLKMYDGFTGRYILSITNVTWAGGLAGFYRAHPTVFGPNGEILSYSITGPPFARRLILWNSTLALSASATGDPLGNRLGIYNDRYSPQQGAVIDGRLGIQWNVSIPNVGGMQYIHAINYDEGIILTTYLDTSTYPQKFAQIAYPTDLQKDATGKYPTSINHLWAQNRTNIYGFRQSITRNIRDGTYVQFDEAKLQFHAYDAKTGAEKWVSDPLPSGWSIFTYNLHLAYGNLYTVGYDGHVRAFNLTNGKLVWDFYFGSSGYETPYGTWPTYAGLTIADGKVYVTNDDHSPDSVPWRGGRLYAIDAYTGKSLWNISGWLRNPAIADGYYTAANSLDGQIYTFGKGKSATTVEAPYTALQVGQKFTITGTVVDMSPAQPGTPAVSDEYMAAWMEYLHMQKQKPANARGVIVKLVAIDPNNNWINIGEAESNLDGTFGLSWAPEVPGLYTVTAIFEGSNSYGSSTASTYFTAIEATAPNAPEQIAPAQSAVDVYFIPAVIGIIVAIAIGFGLTIFVLKRRIQNPN